MRLCELGGRYFSLNFEASHLASSERPINFQSETTVNGEVIRKLLIYAFKHL